MATTISAVSDAQAECGMDSSALGRIGAWQQALVDGGEPRRRALLRVY
jgi:hypothetical protein